MFHPWHNLNFHPNWKIQASQPWLFPGVLDGDSWRGNSYGWIFHPSIFRISGRCRLHLNVCFFLFLSPFRRGISLDPKHWKLGLKVLWGAMAMKCTLSHFFVLNESVALPKPKSPWSSNQVKFEIPSPLRKGYITSTLASRRKKNASRWRSAASKLLWSCLVTWQSCLHGSLLDLSSPEAFPYTSSGENRARASAWSRRLANTPSGLWNWHWRLLGKLSKVSKILKHSSNTGQKRILNLHQSGFANSHCPNVWSPHPLPTCIATAWCTMSQKRCGQQSRKCPTKLNLKVHPTKEKWMEEWKSDSFLFLSGRVAYKALLCTFPGAFRCWGV